MKNDIKHLSAKGKNKAGRGTEILSCEAVVLDRVFWEML